MNELMTDTSIYAFPDGTSGTIWVALSFILEHVLNLMVADDGVGVPVKLGIPNAKSLGPLLIDNFVNLLDATIKEESSGRTSFLISFRY